MNPRATHGWQSAAVELAENLQSRGRTYATFIRWLPIVVVAASPGDLPEPMHEPSVHALALFGRTSKTEPSKSGEPLMREPRAVQTGCGYFCLS